MTLAQAMMPLIAVLTPFLAAPLVAVVGRAWRPAAPLLTALAPASLLYVAWDALPRTLSAPLDAPWTSGLAAIGYWPWLEVGEVSVGLGWTLDSLATLMLLVVGLVALLVIVFSAGYLRDDPGWARYFALIALFTGSMTLLVMGNTFVTLFIGWELVGACSYLLIGFWHERPAAAAATKAFITTRVGDVGLLLGIACLWAATGSVGYEDVMSALGSASPGLLAAAAVCLAVGAIGKSAQFPLHAWLPDAMEGPTPVSALIHAATMVAAGVYLVARVWPLFSEIALAQSLLLVAGALSALGAALVATVQTDIKKVLAYSTVSQLGFMFAALGVGAWGAAFFHLMTHAAFKALLFLASGSAIHGTGTQSIREMGGLRRTMPVTFLTWLVGVLALAGVAPLAGFFSKDAVLESVWSTNPIAGSVLFVASVATAFYAARVTRLAFFGTPSPGLHPHESPLSMLVPLVALAVPAALLGVAHESVAELLHVHAEPLALPVSIVASSAALTGGVLGWLASSGADGDRATRGRLGVVGDLLDEGYRWDAFVDRAVARPAVTASRALWAWGDRFVADGIAEGAASFARAAGRGISRLQSGDAQSYAVAIVSATALVLAVASWLGRW